MTSRTRWIPIGFLFAGGMINYLDRSALSVTAPMIMVDLGLNTAQLGMAFSSFFAGYALFTFIGGYASDLLGPKRVFTISMTVWSTFCGLTAAALGFISLLVFRAIFGCGEGPFGAAANKMVRNWFPHGETATAIGLANAGTPIGGALAGPIAGFLALRYGWRVVFIVIACIGFVWTVFWMVAVADQPERKAGKTDVGKAGEDKAPFILYLRKPAVIATGFSFFGYSYILYFFLTWFPSYLTMARHLKISEMVFINTVPWVLGAGGLTISGLVCDHLAQVSKTVLGARKLVLVTGLALAAICVSLAGLVAGLAWAIGFMSAAIFFIYLTGTTYWAIIQETVPGEHVGAAGGFVHLIANCAGIIGPAVTGWIVQTSGAFLSTFMLAGGISLVGALLVAIFVKKPLVSSP